MANITTQQQTAIANLYTALFNRAPDSDGFGFWVSAYANGAQLSTIVNGFLASPESKAIYPSFQTAEQFITTFYGTVFGRTPDANGLAFWVGALNAQGGASSDAAKAAVVSQIIAVVSTQLTTQPAGLSDADYKLTVADRATFINKSDVGVYYASAQGTSVETAKQVLSGVDATPASVEAAKASIDAVGNTGTTFLLGTGQDFVTGSAGNDTFLARVIDNTNSFQSGDVITGGGGIDTLDITLGNSSNMAVLAETTGVEIVKVRSQSTNIDTGFDTDNTPGSAGSVGNDVSGASIDGELMQGVLQWWNSNSRADLTIEDVRILNSQITKDILIGWQNTDPGDVDYSFFFSPESLRAAAPRGEGAQLTIRLQDVLGAQVGNFLSTLNVRGVEFTVGGQTVILQSNEIQDAATYPALLIAFQNALTALQAAQPTNASIAGLRVIEGDQFLATAGQDDVRRPGTEIIIVNDNDGIIAPTKFVRDSVDTNNYIEFGQLDTAAPQTVESLITATIELDNVGRGSEAGDLLIGSQSTGNSGSRGVEQFDLIVDRTSRFDTLRTTNNTVEVVTIVNKADGANGNLKIEGSNIPYFQRDGVNTRVDSNAGIADVRLLQASTFVGNLDLTAELTSNVKDKYLSLADTQINPAQEDVGFGYNLGTGNDILNLSVSEAVLGNHGVGYADLTIAIDSGAGNDEVNFSIVDGGDTAYVPVNTGTVRPFEESLAANGNWYTHQSNLKNISINTGEGNDTVRTPGAGDLTITTGTGNDTVYVDNAGGDLHSRVVRVVDPVSGLQFTGAQDFVGKATWVLNSVFTTLAPTGNQIDDLVSRGNATYAAVKGQAQVSFEGFSSAWTDIGSNNSASTNLQINQSIKAAINNDAVLNKLLLAEDGPNQTLVLTSLIDGTKVDTDLVIGFRANGITAADVTAYNTANGTAVADAAALTTLVGTTLNALVATDAAYDHVFVSATGSTTGGAAVTALDGADSTFESNNIIDAGAGNDVIVLGTGALSNDTVKFTGLNNGLTSVVHFDAVAASTGIDFIDVTSYLGGSDVSAVTAGAGVLADNNVSITSYSNTLGANGVAFSALTADQLKAAMNFTGTGTAPTADFAGFTAYEATALAVGQTQQDYVLFIENAANAGEYKVFHLAQTNTDGAFETVELVGTVDFGASVSNLSATAPDLIAQNFGLVI